MSEHSCFRLNLILNRCREGLLHWSVFCMWKLILFCIRECMTKLHVSFPPLLSLVQANFPFFFIPAMHIFYDYIESELYSQERTGYFVFSCVGLQNTTYPKCRLCLWTSKAFRDQVSLKDQVKSLLAFAVAIGHTVFSFRVQGGMDFIG